MNKPFSQLELVPSAPASPGLPIAEANAPVGSDWRDFDWTLDKEDVVLEWQPQVAVYRCQGGQILIRQARDAYQDEDPCVSVRPENVPALIAALKRYLP